MKKIILILCLTAFAGLLIYGALEDVILAKRLERCINHYPSDAVCDSCWVAIYGDKKF